MVAPYIVCQLVGGVLGAAMAKVNLSQFCVIKISTLLYVHKNETSFQLNYV